MCTASCMQIYISQASTDIICVVQARCAGVTCVFFVLFRLRDPRFHGAGRMHGMVRVDECRASSSCTWKLMIRGHAKAVAWCPLQFEKALTKQEEETQRMHTTWSWHHRLDIWMGEPQCVCDKLGTQLLPRCSLGIGITVGIQVKKWKPHLLQILWTFRPYFDFLFPIRPATAQAAPACFWHCLS